MNIWTNEALKIIKLLLGNSGQASDIEIAVCLAAAIFSAMIVLRWIGKAFGATMADNGRALTVVGTGLLLALAAVIAFNIYLAPTIKNALLIKWAPIASSSIILIAIVAPMTCLLLKMKYFPVIFVAIFIFVVVVITDVYANVAVIVNKSNPAIDIPYNDLKHILETKKQRWDNNEKITLVFKPITSNETQILINKIYNYSFSLSQNASLKKHYFASLHYP